MWIIIIPLFGFLFTCRFLVLGIFFNDGLEWQEQRRYSLRNLRDFGFGRRFQHLEKELAEELSIMISTIKDGPINDAEKVIQVIIEYLIIVKLLKSRQK